MSYHSGHNWNTSVQAERDALRVALASAQLSLDLAWSAHDRTDADLARRDARSDTYDRAYAAREELRAAQARRARLHADLADCDDDIFDDEDDGSAYDDMAA